MPHLVTVVELHRAKSVRLASPALAPGKENDDCRKGRFRLLPVKFTIASQHGVTPASPQVVKTRTETELWVFGVLVDLGRQAFLNPTIGRFNSRSVMSWPPNLPYFPPPLTEPGQGFESKDYLYVSAWRMCRLISTISASGFFHLNCILFIPSQALPGGSATISKAWLFFNRRHFSVYFIPPSIWTVIWTEQIT